MHPLMEFNQSFHSYDNIEGANCQTVLPRIMTQREAAVEAVKHVGVNQMGTIDPAWFTGRVAEYEMLMRRLEELKI